MSDLTKILLTGAGGRLGDYFLAKLGNRPGFVASSRRGGDGEIVALDLDDAATTEAVVASIKPDIVIHAAAATDVDACEKDPTSAWRANVQATRHLVSALAKGAPGAKLVYLSTDQVYFGPGPNREETAAPRTIYALTKMWGEDIALTLPGALVLRINYIGVGTMDRPNLGDWLVKSLRERKPITLFEDVLFNPVYAGDLPELVLALAHNGAGGVINLGSAPSGMSKAEFARGLARRLNLSLEATKSGRLADAALAAKRPLDTRMDVTRAEKLLNVRLPDAEIVMDRFAADWRQRSELAA